MAGRSAVMKAEMENITEPDKISERWKEYMERLCDNEGKPEADGLALEQETSIPEDCKDLVFLHYGRNRSNEGVIMGRSLEWIVVIMSTYALRILTSHLTH
jgi:hypothetical protein